jgi:hypothetical protein
MYKIQRTAFNKYEVTLHEYSRTQMRWVRSAVWKELTPTTLEAYLEKNRVEVFYIKALLKAFVQHNYTKAYFNSKKELSYLL